MLINGSTTFFLMNKWKIEEVEKSWKIKKKYENYGKTKLERKSQFPRQEKKKYRSKVPVSKKELVASIFHMRGPWGPGRGDLKAPPARPPGPIACVKMLGTNSFLLTGTLLLYFFFPGAGMGFSFLISFFLAPFLVLLAAACCCLLLLAASC